MTDYYVIYSGDKAIFDSRSDAAPPAKDVQCIVQQHRDVGWHTQSGYDFYLRRDGRWVGVDRAGLFEDLETKGLARFNIGIYHEVWWREEWIQVDEYGMYKFLEETGYALFGRTLTTNQFNGAMVRALKIRRVELEKTGWLSNEKRPEN